MLVVVRVERDILPQHSQSRRDPDRAHGIDVIVAATSLVHSPSVSVISIRLVAGEARSICRARPSA